jgi:TPP-dependent pyruvate/acetoin dehydrogenase alpha subunit
MQGKKKRTRAKNLRRPLRVRGHPGSGGKTSGSGKELLPAEKLKLLYSTMLQCRMVKERIRQMFQQGKLTENTRSRTGREASEVGATIDLLPGDCVAPRRYDVVTGFGFGYGLMPRAALKQVLARLLQPSNRGRAREFASKNSGVPWIIAGELPMAARLNISTGVALAYQACNRPNVVVAFSGDDATALGSWHEAVDFAVSHKLPIVHIVQSDVWTEPPDPRLLVAVKDLENTPPGTSIPTLTVDGNDVVAVYRVVQEAIRRAREGHGPSLIECKTQRWPSPPAVTAMQNPSLQEPGGGMPDDPISCMEIYLKQKGLWSDAWKQRLVKSFTAQLDAAEMFAEKSSVKTKL